MHPASEATMHPAPETTAHTSPEAGLAAEGVLVCHPAVVESAECAWAATRLHVRHDEPAIGSMVDRSAPIALGATPKIILMTSKTSAETESVPGSMVDRSAPTALGAIPKIILMTSKTSAETESVPVVYKSVTP